MKDRLGAWIQFCGSLEFAAATNGAMHHHEALLCRCHVKFMLG